MFKPNFKFIPGFSLAKFFLLIFIGVELLYNVVLVSTVQKSESAIHIHISPLFCISFPFSSVGKESVCSTGDPGSIPGWGRSAGEGIGYQVQYSWVSWWIS